MADKKHPKNKPAPDDLGLDDLVALAFDFVHGHDATDVETDGGRAGLREFAGEYRFFHNLKNFGQVLAYLATLSSIRNLNF